MVQHAPLHVFDRGLFIDVLCEVAGLCVKPDNLAATEDMVEDTANDSWDDS